MELSADSYCPAQAMLGEVISIELKYYIYEGEKITDAELVHDGQLR
jgi:hypothetical protein